MDRIQIARPAKNVQQRVDNRIARHVNLVPVHPFPEQIGAGCLGRGPVHIGHEPRDATIHLLRERFVLVVRPQPGLDVADLCAPVIRRQAGHHRGGRVALHQHPIGAFGLDERVQQHEHASGHLRWILPLSHHIQIIIRADVENGQNVIQQLAMLRRYAHTTIERLRPAVHGLHNRGHLDRFRPCSYND